MGSGEVLNDNTISALRGVLQEMTQTIELITTGAQSGQTLISFVEDMLRTIEAWSCKYNVLVDGIKNPNSDLRTSNQIDKSNNSGTEAAQGFVTPKPKPQRRTPSSAKNARKKVPAVDTPASDAKNESEATMVSENSQPKVSMAIVPFRSKEIVERKIEIVDSPEWLPEGWITELKTRGTGSSAGLKDKYYFDPISQRRFRSRREVFTFLESGKREKSKGRQNLEHATKNLGKEFASPEPANNDTKMDNLTTKGGNTYVPQPLATFLPANNNISPLTIPTAGTSFHPGQPSEWLVYESLANLSFPMFDPLYFLEKNTDKRLAPWPWLFNNSEGLKRPFVDNKPDDSKQSDKDKGGQGLSVSHPSEAKSTEPVSKRPKKAARKNAS